MTPENVPTESLDHEKLFRWMVVLAGGLFLTLLVSKLVWGSLFSAPDAGYLDVSSYIALTLVILIVEMYLFSRVDYSIERALGGDSADR